MHKWVRVQNVLLDLEKITKILDLPNAKAKRIYTGDIDWLDISDEEWKRIHLACGAPSDF